MLRKRSLVLCALLYAGLAFGQSKYITKTGVIDIFSQTNLFTIEASNKTVGSILNTNTGDVVVSALVRSFKFHEALVEEHFNENYMESHIYPKATFSGKIIDWSSIDVNKPGTYNVTIEGELTIHGTTNKIIEPAVLKVTSEGIDATTIFNVSLQEYKIEVEESYKDRIRDSIELKVKFNYKLYGK